MEIIEEDMEFNEEGKVIYKLPVRNKTGIIAHVIVSEEDYEDLKKHRIYLNKKGYPEMSIGRNNWTIHRYVMLKISEIAEHLVVDHKNRNKLDSTRENLRLLTVSENCKNKSKRVNTSSKYYGVSFIKKSKKFLANLDSKRAFFEQEYMQLSSTMHGSKKLEKKI